MRLDGALSFVFDMNIMISKSAEHKKEADPDTIGVMARAFPSAGEYMSRSIVCEEEWKEKQSSFWVDGVCVCKKCYDGSEFWIKGVYCSAEISPLPKY